MYSILIELKVVDGFLEQAADAAGRVRLERDVSLSAALRDLLEVFQAGISLVGADLANLESLPSVLDQREELRAVASVLVENADGSHHVRLHAASDMRLHPDALVPRDAVLVIVPFFVAAAAEPAASNGEVRFD